MKALKQAADDDDFAPTTLILMTGESCSHGWHPACDHDLSRDTDSEVQSHYEERVSILFTTLWSVAGSRTIRIVRLPIQ